MYRGWGWKKEKGDYISKNGDVYTGKVYAQRKMTRMGAETKIEEYVWVLSFSSIGVGYASFVGQKKKKKQNQKKNKNKTKQDYL